MCESAAAHSQAAAGALPLAEEEEALLFETLCDGGLDDAAWLGLDESLLLGAGAWAACSAASCDDSAAAAGAAAASSTHAPLAASLHLYRCLDAAHGAGPCGGCSPPPSAGAVGDSAILLDGSGQRGQKALRAQLCRTREWNCAAARAELAALCGADAAFAAALITKRSAGLTKAQMLRMARAWGYASDLWHYHGRASRKRTQAEAQASAEPEDDKQSSKAAVPPRSARARLHAGGFAWGAALGGGDLGAAVTPVAVADEVAEQLTPLAAAAAALLAGPAARRAASAAGAYFGLEEVAAVSAARDAFDTASAAWAAAAPAPAVPLADGDAPWRALRGGDTGAEASLRSLAAVLRRAANANCAVRYFAASAALDAERAGLQAAMAAETTVFDPHRGAELIEMTGAGEGGPPIFTPPAGAAYEAVPPAAAAACAAWLREAYAGLVALAELCVRLQALLADAKLARAAGAFAAADAAARDTASHACAAARNALTERLAWMAETLQLQASALPPQQRRHRPLFAFPPVQAAPLPAPPREAVI